MSVLTLIYNKQVAWKLNHERWGWSSSYSEALGVGILIAEKPIDLKISIVLSATAGKCDKNKLIDNEVYYP